MSDQKQKNILHMMYDKDGYPTWRTELSPEENKVRATVIVPPDTVIPVVFVPGIMGSNLKLKKTLKWFNDKKDIAWRPSYRYFTGKTFGDLKPAQRRMVLDPENTELDERGEIPSSIIQLFKNVPPHVQTNWKSEFTRRGWGTVMLSSYSEILYNLELNLNSIYGHDQEVSNYWKNSIVGVAVSKNSNGESKHPWGEMTGYEALSMDDLKEKVGDKYWFPVHAAGYNWLRSNEDAGKDIAERIKKIIKHYQDLKFDCEKVIIVTHSMGGLAARAACHADMGNIAGKVAGVVHGEQPALGAAAAYKRMHAGFEADGWLGSIFARALGKTGREVTAVLANARGGLELLPNKRYPAGWLQLQAGHTIEMQLPKSNPYKEIYAEKDKWWRLTTPEWIEPSNQPIPNFLLNSIWNRYLKRLALVEKFHDKLGHYYHDITHAHYGVDRNHRAWCNFTWILQYAFRKTTLTDAANAELIDDDAMGKMTIKAHFESYGYNKSEYIKSDTDQPGDGTVPEISGADSASKAKFSSKMTGFSHQDSYSIKSVKDVTTYSVARIARDVC